MSYELSDYQGNKISIPDDKAEKIANVSGLIAIVVDGKTHYINPSNVANIIPKNSPTAYKTPYEIGITVDNREKAGEGYQKYLDMKRKVGLV